MPPRNPARSVLSEESLARRVAYERERRGWSYETLAKRMTQAGYPINQAAIFRIEKGTKDKQGNPGPPRRITVDELVGFAHVFEQEVERLLLPPEAAASEEFGTLLREWDDAAVEARRAGAAAGDARAREMQAFERMRAYVGAHPEVADTATKLMQEWAELRGLNEEHKPELDPLLGVLFGDDESRMREQYLRQALTDE